MKRTIDYQITRADEGIRIEQFLRRQGFSGQNLTLIKRMPQNILLNGQFVYMKDNVHAGDHLRVQINEEASSEKIPPVDLPLDIIYEDEDILHCLVPRLTIQPLVENAVVHGLEPRRGLGSVMVRLWEEDSSVCVRVEDDGVGFDPAEVDLEKAQEAGRHNHIALPNILRRLNLLYGDQASLTIRSHPGSGTQIMLALPIDKEM